METTPYTSEEKESFSQALTQAITDEPTAPGVQMSAALRAQGLTEQIFEQHTVLLRAMQRSGMDGYTMEDLAKMIADPNTIPAASSTMAHRYHQLAESIQDSKLLENDPTLDMDTISQMSQGAYGELSQKIGPDNTDDTPFVYRGKRVESIEKMGLRGRSELDISVRQFAAQNQEDLAKYLEFTEIAPQELGSDVVKASLGGVDQKVFAHDAVRDDVDEWIVRGDLTDKASTVNLKGAINFARPFPEISHEEPVKMPPVDKPNISM